MRVPAFDLQRQYAQIRSDINPVLTEVMQNGHFILGEHVVGLEREVAAYCGVQFAIGVANGSDAIHLALLALGVGPGDEVVVPSFTFFATGGAVARTGATPVFADVDPITFTLDPGSFQSRITHRTRAVIPVHLYGNLAEMQSISFIAREHGINIVEDGAQAIGATLNGQGVGTFGDLATLSFFPTKNLGAFGDGGMVLTNDPGLANRVQMLRTHGARRKYFHEELGYNSRLDEIQAAVLRVKLRHLPAWTQARQRISRRYGELFSGIPIQLPCPTLGCDHVFHQYTVVTENRADFMAFLMERGINTTVYYPLGLHRQPVFTKARLAVECLPVTERLCETAVSLPMFPELTADEVEYVAETVREWASRQ